MRVWAVPFAVVAVAATVQMPIRGQALDAAQILSGVREALGGEKKLASVRSFTATGRTRQIRGNNLVPIEFEINCELPDKFVRTDEFPAQDADPTTLGFNGDDLIQFPPAPPGRGGPPGPPGGRAGGPPPPNPGRGGPPPPTPAQQRVAGVKQDFVRLTLGMFATSFSTYPLTFTYAATGEAPEGKADILDVVGPANFSAQFVVQTGHALAGDADVAAFPPPTWSFAVQDSRRRIRCRPARWSWRRRPRRPSAPARKNATNTPRRSPP